MQIIWIDLYVLSVWKLYMNRGCIQSSAAHLRPKIFRYPLPPPPPAPHPRYKISFVNIKRACIKRSTCAVGRVWKPRPSQAENAEPDIVFSCICSNEFKILITFNLMYNAVFTIKICIISCLFMTLYQIFNSKGVWKPRPRKEYSLAILWTNGDIL